MFLCTFMTAGPSVAILEMTITFFGPPGRHLLLQISKVAYFLTAATLMQGVGNLFWMPLIIKYGRRPVYLGSFTLYTISTVWCSVANSYGNELAARLVLGFSSGVMECLAPLTITDIFFVHERGAIMA
jgi:MFS family permease